MVSFDTKPICLVCNGLSIDGLTHPRCRGKYVIDGSFCAIAYKRVVKRLVYTFKYQPYVSSLGDFLADFMYESIIQQENLSKVLQTHPVLISVPLSSKKLQKRGYNQSQILADKLGKKLGLEVVDCLSRNKETKPQYGLKREERIANIKGAFGFKTNVIPNLFRDLFQEKMLNQVQHDKVSRSAFLVDDILTTGTTLLEAGNVLKRNGFGKVYGICLARDE
jgi:competence protein ComFC